MLSTMTQEDKDKLTGQVRREYRETKQELAALNTKAAQIGENISRAAEALKNAPDSFIFEQQSHDGRFQPYREWLFSEKQFTDFTADNIKTLTSQIRDLTIKVGQLRTRVRELEGEDPEGGRGPLPPHF
jgi:hypothetical protein